MDLVLALLLALLLILITVSSSCGVKNNKYVVRGHQENANMLAEFNKKIETFSNLKEHFQETTMEDNFKKAMGVIPSTSTDKKKAKLDEELAIAEKEQKLAEIKANTAALEKDKTQAEQDTKTIQTSDSASNPEFYRNYW